MLEARARAPDAALYGRFLSMLLTTVRCAPAAPLAPSQQRVRVFLPCACRARRRRRRREEVGNCAQKAYRTLTLDKAQKLLKMDTAEATRAFVAQRGWRLEGDTIVFAAPAGGAGVGAMEEDGGAAAAAAGGNGLEGRPMAMISQSLAYARELESIV